MSVCAAWQTNETVIIMPFSGYNKKESKIRGLLMKLLFAAMLLVSTTYGATSGAGHPRSTSLTTTSPGNTTRLGPNYGENNGTFFSDLSGVSQFAIFNGSSLGSIAISFPLGNNTCGNQPFATMTTREFVVPASTGFSPDKLVAINKYACVRSKTGSSLASGTIELTVW